MSIVQVTGTSASSEERTLQYLVTDSSTARAAFSPVMPAPFNVKCRTADASRRGIALSRVASTLTLSASSGVRCFLMISTTSVAAHVAMAASNASNGLGPVSASPSIRIWGP